jgi:hypothetical protein
MSWSDLETSKNGQPVEGSEGGILIVDQEHDLGARISLERGCVSAPFAITCGIYGWMVHTRYFDDERRAQEQFVLMRDALDAILARMPYDDDPDLVEKKRATIRDIGAFVERFP